MIDDDCNGEPLSWPQLLSRLEFGERRPSAGGRQPLAADAVGRILREAGLLEWAALAGGAITLVVNDGHRFTDTRAFLDAALPLLDSAARGEVTLRALVAAGTHRSTPEERAAHEARMFAGRRERFAEVAWHDARDPNGLIDVGGVGLHRWMGERASYLACGSAEPHYFAGVTGAHKTLTVGVMSTESIEANHALAMLPEAGGLRLEGNPVFEGIAAVVDKLADSGARLFACNQVLVDGAVIACTAGEPIAALMSALPVVGDCFAASVQKPVDLLVATVEPPLDRDLYQADKGIKNTEAAVRDGGVLILEAACAGGVGIDHFLETLRKAPTYRAALELVERRGYRLGDHKAVRLRHLSDSRGVSVAVVSAGLDPALGEALGMRVFADRASAAAWALERLPASSGRALEVHDAGNLTLTVAA